MNTIVQLLPLECSDREQFISDNQEAFNYGFNFILITQNDRMLDKQFPDGMFRFEKVIR